ncbi:MAG: hypothetical protein ACUVTG_06355 [Candidatus Oleimicrobiaceae bacterium]
MDPSAGSLRAAQNAHGPHWPYVEGVDSALSCPICPHITRWARGPNFVVLDDPENGNWFHDVL